MRFPATWLVLLAFGCPGARHTQASQGDTPIVTDDLVIVGGLDGSLYAFPRNAR